MECKEDASSKTPFFNFKNVVINYEMRLKLYMLMFTSNEPPLLTNGREQINMMAKIIKIAQPVKLAHPGMRPNIPGHGVNSQSLKIIIIISCQEILHIEVDKMMSYPQPNAFRLL